MKRGIQIGEHGDHKLRQKHTVTFGAPVELNGVRGKMAVVVKLKNKKYYVHRIVLPDGSAFKYESIKNNAEQEMYQGVPKRSLANTTSSASSNSIPQNSEKSNSSDKNSSGKLKKAIESGRRSSLSSKEKPYPKDYAEKVVNRILSEYMTFGTEYGTLEPSKKKAVVNMIYKGLNNAESGKRAPRDN